MLQQATFKVFAAVLISSASEIGAVLTKNGFEPPIFLYDDYELCHFRYNPAVYCHVKVVTVLDPKDDLHDTNRIVTDFRPNLLSRAVCVPDCEREVSKLSEHQKAGLDHPKVDIHMKYMFSTKYFPSYEQHERQYGEVLKLCVNLQLQKKYNVTGYVRVEHCEVNDQSVRKEFDWAEISFMVISAALVGLVIYTMFKDANCQADAPGDITLVSAFSIKRNWRSFIEAPSSQIHQDFRYIEGLRVATCAVVLLAHVISSYFMLPFKNPEVLQQLSNSISTHIGTSLLPVIIQVFFTITGMLTTVHFLRETNLKTDFEWRLLGNKLLGRLIRFLPVYAMGLLFVSSWYRRISQSTVAFKTLETSYRLCRSTWWTNVLFINNYLEEICMAHSWYLAADMQMFIIALGILALLWKFPKRTSGIFVVAALVALVGPAYAAYKNKTSPILAVALSNLQTEGFSVQWVHLIYMPGPLNLGSYVSGMFAGYVYNRICQGGSDLRETKAYRIIKACSTPAFFISTILHCIWMRVEFDRPSIWVSLYVTLSRNCVPVVTAIWFIEGIQRPMGPVRKFFCKRIFSWLGKLCYIVYIVHYPLIKAIFSRADPNAEVDQSTIGTIFVGYSMLSFGLAFVIYFCLEQPLGVYLKDKLIRTGSPVGKKTD